jgi:hypothetical protein
MSQSDVSQQESLADPAAARFTLALSDAIALFTEQKSAEDFFAWSYRGADLRFVVARWLYFALINDDELFAFYCGRGTAPTALAATWIAPFFARSAPEARRSERLVTSVRSFAARASHFLRTWRVPRSQPSIMKADILFHVGAFKFFRYLAPLVEEAGADAAYLCLNDQVLADAIAATGGRVIHLQAATDITPVGYVSAALKDWLSLCRDYDAFLDLFLLTGCRTVVVAEGNSPQNELVARAARAAGVRSVCIQQGWSPIIHTGFRCLYYDAMCVWGAEIARLLAPANPKQRFFVTGSHVLQANGGRPVVERQAIGFFLQKGSRLITAAAWAAMLDLVAWSAETYPDRPILVREHPGAPLDADERAVLARFSNIMFTPADTHPLAEVMIQCRVAVSIFSTTLLEAAASGAIPLIVNVTGLERFLPDLEALGAGLEVKSAQDAKLALDRIIGPAGDALALALEPASRAFFARLGSPACDAIKSVIAAAEEAAAGDLAWPEQPLKQGGLTGFWRGNRL